MVKSSPLVVPVWRDKVIKRRRRRECEIENSLIHFFIPCIVPTEGQAKIGESIQVSSLGYKNSVARATTTVRSKSQYWTSKHSKMHPWASWPSSYISILSFEFFKFWIKKNMIFLLLFQYCQISLSRMTGCEMFDVAQDSSNPWDVVSPTT